MRQAALHRRAPRFVRKKRADNILRLIADTKAGVAQTASEALPVAAMAATNFVYHLLSRTWFAEPMMIVWYGCAIILVTISVKDIATKNAKAKRIAILTAGVIGILIAGKIGADISDAYIPAISSAG